MESSRVQLIVEDKISISEFRNSKTNEQKRSEIGKIISKYQEDKQSENPSELPILIMNESEDLELIPIIPHSQSDDFEIGYSGKSSFYEQGYMHGTNKAFIFIHESYLPEGCTDEFLKLVTRCFSPLKSTIEFTNFCDVETHLFTGDFHHPEEVNTTPSRFRKKAKNKMKPYFTAILHPNSEQIEIQNTESQASQIRFDYFPNQIYENQISTDSGLQIIFEDSKENEVPEKNRMLSNFLDIIASLIKVIWVPDMNPKSDRRDELILNVASKMLGIMSLNKTITRSRSIDRIPRCFLFCNLSNKSLSSPKKPDELSEFLETYNPSLASELEHLSFILEDYPQREMWDNFQTNFSQLIEAIFESLLSLKDSLTEDNQQIFREISEYYF